MPDQRVVGADLLSLDLDALVAGTDAAILRLLDSWSEQITATMYEQIRYHMGYGDPRADRKSTRLNSSH